MTNWLFDDTRLISKGCEQYGFTHQLYFQRMGVQITADKRKTKHCNMKMLHEQNFLITFYITSSINFPKSIEIRFFF